MNMTYQFTELRFKKNYLALFHFRFTLCYIIHFISIKRVHLCNTDGMCPHIQTNTRIQCTQKHIFTLIYTSLRIYSHMFHNVCRYKFLTVSLHRIVFKFFMAVNRVKTKCVQYSRYLWPNLHKKKSTVFFYKGLKKPKRRTQKST